MKAVHLSDGARGYGVESDDGVLIATGMTRDQAVTTARGGEEPDPKLQGNNPLPKSVPVDNRATRHHTFSHNQAQSPDDWM